MEARLERHNNLPAMNDGAMMVRQFASASHFKICNLKWVFMSKCVLIFVIGGTSARGVIQKGR